eukprot:683103-Rhodomonas_salina.1
MVIGAVSWGVPRRTDLSLTPFSFSGWSEARPATGRHVARSTSTTHMHNTDSFTTNFFTSSSIRSILFGPPQVLSSSKHVRSRAAPRELVVSQAVCFSGSQNQIEGSTKMQSSILSTPSLQD